MKDIEKEMLEDYNEDAERFKNFCLLLFVIGAAIGTILMTMYINL